MINRIKRFFRMKGTWEWACDQMLVKKMVTRASFTGSVRYRLDLENQKRIQWSLDGIRWKNANIFLSDFCGMDWIIYKLS